MTPQQIKAKDLVEKFIYINSDQLTQECSKQCAIIACNEVLNLINESEIENAYWIKYYQEVKEEIEKL